MLALALSAPFTVAQRWNPLWGLTVTLGGTHTNLPAAPGGAPRASGAGILAGQEPCVSLLLQSLPAQSATWRRSPRTERRKCFGSQACSPSEHSGALNQFGHFTWFDGTTWFGATCAFRCVPIRGGRSDGGEGGEPIPKAPPREDSQLCVCSTPSPRCSELCRVSPGVAQDMLCPPWCWQGGCDGSCPPEATCSCVAQPQFGSGWPHSAQLCCSPLTWHEIFIREIQERMERAGLCGNTSSLELARVEQSSQGSA